MEVGDRIFVKNLREAKRMKTVAAKEGIQTVIKSQEDPDRIRVYLEVVEVDSTGTD